MTEYDYLIVGGGMAADAAVQGIRQRDENGTIAIISEEAEPPYSRPHLSKDLWTGDQTLDDISLQTTDKRAEVILETRVTALDPAGARVRDARGHTYQGGRILLATGGTPRRLPFEDDPVIYYRTSRDYRRLRELTETGDNFGVLGGGFIGWELAAALASNHKQVSMVFPEHGIGGKLFPAPFAAALTAHYRERGVEVISGRKPSGVKAEDGRYALMIEDGRTLYVDGLVAGLGVEPNTRLAAQAGLEVDDGIQVDDQLRTSHPNVFAAGDVARFYNPLLATRIRVEHEDNALNMGAAAGRNMAGGDENYSHLPFFYSDLFDLGFEAVGEISASMQSVTELEDPTEPGVIFYRRGDEVRGVLFWNSFGRMDAARDLMQASSGSTADELIAWGREQLSAQ